MLPSCNRDPKHPDDVLLNTAKAHKARARGICPDSHPEGTCKMSHRSQVLWCRGAARARGRLLFPRPAPTRTAPLCHGTAPASPAHTALRFLPSVLFLTSQQKRALVPFLEGRPVPSPTPRSQAKKLLCIRLLVPFNWNTTTKVEREAPLRGRHRRRGWVNEPLIQNWPCW